MSLLLTPLEEARLSPAARKVAGAGASAPLQMMAARGLAPLPPPDLAVVLYQLSLVGEVAVVEAARKTARELPDPIVHGALSGPLDPRVLDHFARLLVERARPLHAILLNPATDDQTFAFLASTCAEAELEIIAQNEQRQLRHPAIITALYHNPKTRMSTATRALELAARNGIRPDGIASFDDIKAALESEGPSDPTVDNAFASVLSMTAAKARGVGAALEALTDEEARALLLAQAANEEAEKAAEALSNDDKAVQIGKLNIGAKIRLATLGNAFARAVLVRDSNKVVALAAVRSPAVTEHEAEMYAGNRGLQEEVIRHIAGQKQFTRRYTVKLSLVNNPKCPLQAAMAFLQFLTPKDLRIVARSKSIPSALAKAAQGLVQKRESGGRG